MEGNVLFLIPSMAGGGAERVLGILASKMAEDGYRSTLMLTNQLVRDAVGYEMSPKVSIESLISYEKRSAILEKTYYFILKEYTRVIGTLFDFAKLQVPERIAYDTFIWQYHNKVEGLKNYLSKDRDIKIIAFCQPAINIALLATENLPNEVILSERLDPARYKRNRYMPYFIRRWYPTAKHLVFQTESAKSLFCKEIQEKSTVIPNPINSSLPEPYTGQRDKTIVTFCRITPQKNLQLLIDAFSVLHKKYTDYDLEIYGEGESEKEIREYIRDCDLSSSVRIRPFDDKLHYKIRKHAMYVSSSDYEGMSNSMLEALAIGLPTICTDCPAGGARAVIKDHENGLLVPIKDRDALVAGMQEIIENQELSDKISQNGARIRNEFNVDSITSKWEKLLL